MSFFRNWLYLYLKTNQVEAAFEKLLALLGEPYRTQYPFPGLHRIVDFALHLRKVVIEIDGTSHDTPVQAYKDTKTSIALEERGWRVIRFRNSEVAGIESPVQLRELIDLKLSTRPTLAELRAALLQLPEPPVKLSKPRGRRRVPGPKKAKKSA